ncbi:MULTISPECIES: hypothetical protein [Ramlibacter]|uniref:Uncharacterized protein n=1 Tax=Ramlibacter pinisoli TaxID=2682844 RepID=A0A6N8IRM1_9BURK|nr:MULTISPECIES: hypothetical protein [Ramlibacter]MBA2964239.1 hypothetical protein [Ramlibacter sp. CGMCC 1.13660]MVQ29205.1 hypothetical protein [Ramlibacter pinisoli]
MNTLHRRLVPVLLAIVVTAVAAADADQQKAVTAQAAGTVAAAGPATEAVVFSGQASISGRVVRDTTFGAPPVLEIIVDMKNVTGKGVRSGKAYLVSSESIVRRPLAAFEQVEVSFPFAPDGNVLQARSAMASFGVNYNASKGLTTTPVRISAQNPT